MKKKYLLLVSFLFIIFCFLTVLYNNNYYLIGIDDANIYFIYMKNFALGNDFVYNKGGELVEGFTSLLWTLIGSFFFLIFNNLQIPLLIFNLILLFYTVFNIINYINYNVQKKSLLILFLILFFLTPSFFDWTILSLLETGLWSFVLVNITINLLNTLKGKNKKVEFNVLMFLMVFIRPESLFFGILFFSLKFGIDLFRINFYKSIKNNIVSFLSFVLANIILFSWRLYYFGFLFPNTYYAKVSHNFYSNFIAGYIYIKSYFVQNPIVFISFFGGFILLVFITLKKQSIRKYSDILLLLSVLFIAYIFPIYSGGDHFGGFRFYQPTAPLSILLLILLINKIFIVNRNLYLVLIVLFQLVFSFNNNIKNLINRNSTIKSEFEIALDGKLRSEKLYNFFKINSKLPSQGIIAAGGANYYEGVSIDLVGLNNVEMAHSKKDVTKKEIKNHFSFNKEIFYKQLPDILWICGDFLNFEDKRIPKVRDWEGNIIKNVHLEKRFNDIYSRYEIVNLKNRNYLLRAYLKDNFVENLNIKYYTWKKLD